MRNLNLDNSGFTEINNEDITAIDGGKVPYLEYSWSGTDNELVYTIEAGANLLKLAGNGGIAIWNAFT